MKNEPLIAGDMYSGEVLKCDYGIQNLNDDSMYVILNSGEVVEVVNV